MLKDWHKQPRPRLAAIAAGLALLGLAGCSATGKSGTSAATSENAEPAASAKGLLAKGGTTASSRYVDPALVSAASVAENAPAEQPAYGGPQEEPALAGAVMRPTGIRAGSVSIFSTPAPAAAEPMATGTVRVGAAAGRVDATAGSVFSVPAPPAAGMTPDCGTDLDGTPLNC